MAAGEMKDGSDKIDFPHFDILSGHSVHSDHHYNKSNKFNAKNNVLNTIAKEWKILEESLPESIYVRVYEDRIDLLRAVIIGARGTPYHDGLFFFDIILPPDYPKKPPQVHYHSHGMRLNPNLYNDGYVCLSLIHTWPGSGVELWKPGKSTILQLLVSLQGLVLNDKPFFNEPSNVTGLKNMNESWKMKSMTYNEGVFIYSCKTMLCKMRNPPKGFESFVVEHFCSHGDFILAAIMAYANGEALVGQYKEVGSSVSSSPVGVSSNCKSELMKIHSDLQSAFLGMDGLKIKNSMELQSEAEEDGNALPSPPKSEAATVTLELQKKVGNRIKGLSGMIFKVLKCGLC